MDSRIDRFLKSTAFKTDTGAPCFYVRQSEGQYFIKIALYVSDFLIAGQNMTENWVDKVESHLTVWIKSLGKAKVFLELEILRVRNSLKFCFSRVSMPQYLQNLEWMIED